MNVRAKRLVENAKYTYNRSGAAIPTEKREKKEHIVSVVHIQNPRPDIRVINFHCKFMYIVYSGTPK